jgi:hypothetical protein
MQNTGDGILEIKVSLSGDAGFSISPSGTVNLGDGQMHWITIQFSPTAEGTAGASLALTSDAGDVEVGLAGRGFESALLAFEPLNFRQIETGKSTTAVVQLTNPGPVHPILARPLSSPYLASLRVVESRWVAFVPAAFGTFTSEIVITRQNGQSGTI